MDEIQWLAEAVLASNDRVFCAGTLAQCVRRWTRLPEIEQSQAVIKVGRHSLTRQLIAAPDIAALAARPEAFRL